jgi:hypothetical protein
MMSTFAWLVVLAAAEPSAPSPSLPSPTRVLVLDTSGDLAADQRLVLTNLVAVRLQRFPSLRVVAQRDVQQRLGLETAKQLAGCESDTACIAELAGAFDVDLLCVTAASRLGGTIVFTLQIIDERGEAKARGSVSVPALDDVAVAVSAVADDAGRLVSDAEPIDAPASAPSVSASPSSSSLPTPLSSSWSLPLQVGGVAGVVCGLVAVMVGAVPGVMARSAEGDLTALRVAWLESGASDPDVLSDASQKQLEIDGQRAAWNSWGLPLVWGGAILSVVGGAAIAAGTVLTEEGP